MNNMRRIMRKPVLTVVLLIILFALDGCGKKQQQSAPPVITSGAVGAASGVLRSRISLLWSRRKDLRLSILALHRRFAGSIFHSRHFLVQSKMIHSMSFFVGLRLARCFRMNFAVSHLVPVSSLVRMAIFLPMLMLSRMRMR